MIIGIDAAQAATFHRTGVQWYAYYLLHALKSIVPPSHHVRLYTPTSLSTVFKPFPSHWEERVLSWPLKHGWTIVRLAHELRKNQPDVFFTPGHIIPPCIPCKSVVTIHDLGFREFPRAYTHPRLMNFFHARDAKKAHTIITPSQTTKDAIVQAYAVNPGKIHVIPHGYDAEIYHPYDEAEVQQTLNRFGIKKPYVITVGRLEEKKNTLQVLKLVQSIRSQLSSWRRPTADDRIPEILSLRSRMTLVLVGPPGYGYNRIQQWITENKAGEWAKELGWLPSEDTAKLISGASALITLSRAEGFGLTILESLACNTPILASDIPPHHEVGKDMITYTDPNNLIESTIKLTSLLQTFKPYNLHTLPYTWAHSAQQTLDVLLNV